MQRYFSAVHIKMFGVSGHYLLLCISQVVILFYFHSFCVFASYHSSEAEQAQRSASEEKEEKDGSLDNTELDNKINKTLDTLQRLDAALAQDCNDPPVNGGEKMKRMVQEYNEACTDLLLLCKKDKLRVLNAASDMIEPGGPKFLDVEINKREAMKNFKWDENNVDEFLNLTKKTYSCWKKLWSLYNNFP